MSEIICFESAADLPEPFRVRVYPDPVLREKSVAVESFDDELRRMAERMAATMLARRGVGLAANPVGLAMRRGTILAGPGRRAAAEADGESPGGEEAGEEEAGEESPGEEEASAEKAESPPPDVRVLINPEIVAAEGKVEADERCLSLPPEEMQAKVRRAAFVRVEYRDLAGNPAALEGEGLLARALQHEIDHLNGILFIDRASSLKRFSLRKHLREMEEDYESQMNF